MIGMKDVRVPSAGSYRTVRTVENIPPFPAQSKRVLPCLTTSQSVVEYSLYQLLSLMSEWLCLLRTKSKAFHAHKALTWSESPE